MLSDSQEKFEQEVLKNGHKHRKTMAKKHRNKGSKGINNINSIDILVDLIKTKTALRKQDVIWVNELRERYPKLKAHIAPALTVGQTLHLLPPSLPTYEYSALNRIGNSLPKKIQDSLQAADIRSSIDFHLVESIETIKNNSTPRDSDLAALCHAVEYNSVKKQLVFTKTIQQAIDTICNENADSDNLVTALLQLTSSRLPLKMLDKNSKSSLKAAFSSIQDKFKWGQYFTLRDNSSGNGDLLPDRVGLNLINPLILAPHKAEGLIELMNSIAKDQKKPVQNRYLTDIQRKQLMTTAKKALFDEGWKKPWIELTGNANIDELNGVAGYCRTGKILFERGVLLEPNLLYRLPNKIDPSSIDDLLLIGDFDELLILLATNENIALDPDQFYAMLRLVDENQNLPQAKQLRELQFYFEEYESGACVYKVIDSCLVREDAPKSIWQIIATALQNTCHNTPGVFANFTPEQMNVLLLYLELKSMPIYDIESDYLSGVHEELNGLKKALMDLLSSQLMGNDTRKHFVNSLENELIKQLITSKTQYKYEPLKQIEYLTGLAKRIQLDNPSDACNSHHKTTTELNHALAETTTAMRNLRHRNWSPDVNKYLQEFAPTTLDYPSHNSVFANAAKFIDVSKIQKNDTCHKAVQSGINSASHHPIVNKSDYKRSYERNILHKPSINNYYESLNAQLSVFKEQLRDIDISKSDIDLELCNQLQVHVEALLNFRRSIPNYTQRIADRSNSLVTKTSDAIASTILRCTDKLISKAKEPPSIFKRIRDWFFKMVNLAGYHAELESKNEMKNEIGRTLDRLNLIQIQ